MLSVAILLCFICDSDQRRHQQPALYRHKISGACMAVVPSNYAIGWLAASLAQAIFIIRIIPLDSSATNRGFMRDRYNVSTNHLPYGRDRPETESENILESEPEVNRGLDRSTEFDLHQHRRRYRGQPVQRRSVHKKAVVGRTVVLDCDFPLQRPTSSFPSAAADFNGADRVTDVDGDDDVQADEKDDQVKHNQYDNGAAAAAAADASGHMIKWHKQGIEVPIFIQLNRLPAHVDGAYLGRLRLMDDRSSIELSDVRAEDEGWYECSVVYLRQTDEGTPNGSWIYLTVTAPPSLGAVSPNFVIFREGHSAELSCDAVTGIPTPIASWLKDGREVDQTSRLQVVHTTATMTSGPGSSSVLMPRHLVSTGAAAAVGGHRHHHYTVGAETHHHETQQPPLQQQPQQQQQQQPLQQQHRQQSVLPPPLPLRPRTRLIIKHVVAADAGDYTCLFKNTEAQVSHTIHAIVRADDWTASNAHIVVPPKNTTVIEGSQVRFDCLAAANPDNVTYRWYHNGYDIDARGTLMTSGGAGGGSLSARSVIETNGSLVVATVSRDDSGWYRCRPTNGVGVPPEAQAFLNVTYGARVLSQPSHIYLTRSMAGRLNCPADANPPVTRVTWTKDGRPVQVQQVSRSSGHRRRPDDDTESAAAAASASAAASDRVMISDDDGALMFERVTAEDAGRYSCTPHSQLGTGQTSVPVQVLVKDPPFFLMRPRSIYQKHQGQSVSMPCVADGDPKPTITWRKGDGAFPTSRAMHHDGGNLTILHLSKDDQGSYECVASNAVTNVITTSLLLVEISSTATHAPYEVTVTTSQTSAKVSWLPAYDGGHPQHYVLWYKPDRSQETWRTLQVLPVHDQPAMSMTVHNLQPNTTYQFMVLARNKLGQGQFSNAVIAETAGYRRPSVDENIDVERDDDNTADDCENVQGDQYSYVTCPGDPVASGDDDNDKINQPARVSGQLRPIPPINVTAKLQRDGGLNIAWLPPKNSPISIDWYLIEYRTVGQWVPLGEPVSSDRTWYVWKTPSRGVTYYFRVFSRSETAGGLDSEPSPTTSILGEDPLLVTSKWQLPDMTIIVPLGAGLLFIVTVAVIVLVFRLRQHRKQHTALRYDGVKYFDSTQIDSAQNNDRIPEGIVNMLTDTERQMHSIENHENHENHDNHVTVTSPITTLNRTNHERKPIQETPI